MILLLLIIVIPFPHSTAVQPVLQQYGLTDQHVLFTVLPKLSDCTACLKYCCFLHYNIYSRAGIEWFELACDLFGVIQLVMTVYYFYICVCMDGEDCLRVVCDMDLQIHVCCRPATCVAARTTYRILKVSPALLLHFFRRTEPCKSVPRPTVYRRGRILS